MTASRREFLFLAGAAALEARRARARMTRSLSHDVTIVNALGDLDDPNHPDTGPAVITSRMLTDAHASGLAAVNVTLGYVSGPEKDPYRFTLGDVAHWDGLIRDHSADLLKVLSVADIHKARREHRIGLIFGFQNAAMMGSDAGRVDVFADKGVRVIQLTYNPANQLGGGSMAPETMGLTPFGREVVERLNARRVMAICADPASSASSRGYWPPAVTVRPGSARSSAETSFATPGRSGAPDRYEPLSPSGLASTTT